MTTALSEVRWQVIRMGNVLPKAAPVPAPTKIRPSPGLCGARRVVATLLRTGGNELIQVYSLRLLLLLLARNIYGTIERRVDQIFWVVLHIKRNNGLLGVPQWLS